MKFFAAAMLGATVALAGPVTAQDRDGMSNMRNRTDTAFQHRVTHPHVTYRRTYKTDEEEHQATENLNCQYRGVPDLDQHYSDQR